MAIFNPYLLDPPEEVNQSAQLNPPAQQQANQRMNAIGNTVKNVLLKGLSAYDTASNAMMTSGMPPLQIGGAIGMTLPKVVKALPKLNTLLENKVLRKWGTTDNPELASFISSKGKYIGWGDNNGGAMTQRLADHREIAGGNGTDGLIDYMNKTKNIRVHNQPNTSDVNVDVVYQPTKEQIPALQKMMEGKKIYSDVSTPEGGNKVSGEFNNFNEWLDWVKKHAL